MKFMSRLGPNDSTPTASSPLASSNPSTPTNQRAGDDDDNERSSKRRRTSGDLSGTATSVASTGSPMGGNASASIADMEATMRASMDEEERRRQAAIKKRAAELGDEHWTWTAAMPPQVAAKLAASKQGQVKLPYNVVRVGYAEIDRSAADGNDNFNNKTNTMRFNMKQAAVEEEEEEEDTKPTKKRSRSEVDAYSKKRDMPKLKNLTSLSSQGGQSAMKCHRCGKPGHKAMECPSAPKRNGSKRR